MSVMMDNFINHTGMQPQHLYLPAQQEDIVHDVSEDTIKPEVRKLKKNGGGGKVIASAIIPGVGQALDGRYGAGATYCIGSAGLILGLIYSVRSFVINGGEFMLNKFKHMAASYMDKKPNVKMLDIDLFKNLYKTAGAKCFVSMIAGGLCSLAIPIFYGMNLVDAYKGKRVKEIEKY